MDTNRLKRFATEARNILMQGVAHRFTALGFLPDGTVTEEPQPLGGGATFMGDTVSDDFYKKWCSLQHAVEAHSIEEVAEEAAYTWFNRLVAIRIMVKNGLIAPVLQYESEGVHIPLLVSEARQGRMPEMTADDQRKLEDLLLDDSKTDEQFRILIVAFCHTNPVINSCFGHISDYTELLLPTNILAEGGFVDMLNNTEFIIEEDYHSPELIGWLYQFYISEKKDYIINSGKKAEVKDIPARTQLFTPNWIVKYMVHNSLGRIYLDNNPFSNLKQKLDYYIKPEAATPQDSIFQLDDVHKLTCADLGCGSGHILNEAFDILYDIYIEEGYSRKKAIEDIFRYNLVGIDIDTRAKQLAQFALLLKACQKDISFTDAHVLPVIYDMPDPYQYKDNLSDILLQFFNEENHKLTQEVTDAIELMDQAKNIGSIMKFNISDSTRDTILKRISEDVDQEICSDEIIQLKVRLQIIIALTAKYSTIIMNPPYMGNSYMNDELKMYVSQNYPDGKNDLFSAFMYKCHDLLLDNGSIGYVCPFVWMFIASFTDYRSFILKEYNISSLIQLEYNAFEPACVPICTYTLIKTKNRFEGSYIKLSQFRGHQNQAPRTLEAINNRSCGWFYKFNQCSCDVIPGTPIGYWLSENLLKTFEGKNIGDISIPKQGLITGDNNRFLRLWYETSLNKTSFNHDTTKKWFPINKGGEFRRWAGNNSFIVNWDNNGYEICNFFDEKGKLRSRPQNLDYNFREAVSWSLITSSGFSARKYSDNSMFNVAGICCFPDKNIIDYILGLLNSKVSQSICNVINPTLNMNAGDIAKIPVKIQNQHSIEDKVKNCTSISRCDWDSHETSWDFQRNELLMMDEQVLFDNLDYIIEKHYKETGENICIDPAAPQPESVEWCYDTYCTKWERLFMQLHENEEELNRQFIDIYGLQDELTPDVPLDEITILQQGEIKIEDGELKWNADVVMKQLISYAVGCMMGRYSIDKPGLILANQGDGLEQYNEQVPNSRFEPDDDGIIPLMSAQSDFADNATIRFKQWLVAAFGEETLVENLNFIEKCLGKGIDDYFVKDFWKDHKKMYQNRPIYWLFSSKKGAFQCLAYMHRMDAYTAERIRTKYLLPHIEWLLQKQGEMEANAANLNARERKELDNIGKQIEECREYHDRLHVIADKQIAFDLDDGVVVNYAKFGDVLSKLK